MCAAAREPQTYCSLLVAGGVTFNRKAGETVMWCARTRQSPLKPTSYGPIEAEKYTPSTIFGTGDLTHHCEHSWEWRDNSCRTRQRI